MENSNSKNNKDKYKRPDVIESESSKNGIDENELVGTSIDGPFRGAQSARGLAPIQGAGPLNELSSHCRILISKEASQSLDGIAAKVGDGFEGGRIGRPQIVSWILRRFADRITGSDVEEIRATYFDRIAYLESLLKRAKETGVAPAELDALFPGQGGNVTLRRKYKRRANSA